MGSFHKLFSFGFLLSPGPLGDSQVQRSGQLPGIFLRVSLSPVERDNQKRVSFLTFPSLLI